MRGYSDSIPPGLQRNFTDIERRQLFSARIKQQIISNNNIKYNPQNPECLQAFQSFSADPNVIETDGFESSKNLT
ncbi:MAG: hypothetical protein CVT92_09160 [Bacteroidetes bacterium HGW-Bacteroidetes-1]|jgi:hypothetical protein|nr:MAG: hypothetical protein CVT92_09160 [Bacteroidetes bacterium HGW-Bacteroidetes-1]